MSSKTRTNPGKQFERGNQFGKGRPPGSRNKSILALEDLLDRNGEILTLKLLELAKKGVQWALKFCMERIVARPQERPMILELPEIRTQEDLVKAFNGVVQAVTQGHITSEQAKNLTSVLESGQKFIENRDLGLQVQAMGDEIRKLKEDVNAERVA